jgi:D-alanyl-D-alanine carboxypeptidase/D-alanyl-D-alanine-endopeptidase (penicillin-binding protein 4)
MIKKSPNLSKYAILDKATPDCRPRAFCFTLAHCDAFIAKNFKSGSSISFLSNNQNRVKKSVLDKFSILFLVVAFFGLANTLSAQVSTSTPRPPLLQTIQIPNAQEQQQEDKSLVQKTASADIVKPAPISYSPINTSIPLFENIPIPGYSGILVETLDGQIIIESGSNLAYNPASNVKIATAYAVLKAFRPDFRFKTDVWTDGSFEVETGTIHGNIFISGQDPVFNYDHALTLAEYLNRMGVRSVTGDLVVTPSFVLAYDNSASRSSARMLNALDASRRTAGIIRELENAQIRRGKSPQNNPLPAIAISGKSRVDSLPADAKLLITHESAKLIDILKATLSYSNNFVAEKLGAMVGGPSAIALAIQKDTGALPNEFYIQTASGLGVNRVTPQAMMKLLRLLRAELAKNRLTFADIMPVAGIDQGTLEGRFDTDFARGSVVGKTGTLGRTDGGVSSLAGEIYTKNGTLLFVIFNQRGSVSRFRKFQNEYVSTIQGQFGGAAPLDYRPPQLDTRLAETHVNIPRVTRSAGQ